MWLPTAMTKPGQRLPTSMQRRTSASMASRPPESRMDVSALPTNTWVLPYFSAIQAMSVAGSITKPFTPQAATSSTNAE